MAAKKPKDKQAKSDKKKSQKKSKPDKTADSSTAQAMDETADDVDAPSAKQILTHEDALALAEAIVEMVNEGATDPVAFFVSGDDPLGRELIRLQGGEAEEMDGLVPVVLDAPHVRRYGMLTIADEMMWRGRDED